jgi:hypothetical protein
MNRFAPIVSGMTALSLLAPCGCRSKHVEVVIENRSHEPVRLLEVDLASASFGKDRMAPEESYRYQIQVRGSGKVKVEYTSADGRTVESEGEELTEGESGRLVIWLEPQGKIEFRLNAQSPQ